MHPQQHKLGLPIGSGDGWELLGTGSIRLGFLLAWISMRARFSLGWFWGSLGTDIQAAVWSWFRVDSGWVGVGLELICGRELPNHKKASSTLTHHIP